MYLSIQAAYITCIIHDLGILEVSWKIQVIVHCKLISCSWLVHRLMQSIWGISALPPNQRDGLSWSLGWVFNGKWQTHMVTHWIRPTVNYDIDYQEVIISPRYYALLGLSTLREYWFNVEIFNGFDIRVRS